MRNVVHYVKCAAMRNVGLRPMPEGHILRPEGASYLRSNTLERSDHISNGLTRMLITFFNVDNSVDKFFKKFCIKVGISGKKCIILKPEKFVYKWIIR